MGTFFGVLTLFILAYAGIAFLTIFSAQLVMRFLQDGTLYSVDREASILVGVLWPIAVPICLVILAGSTAYDACTKASQSAYEYFKKDK